MVIVLKCVFDLTEVFYVVDSSVCLIYFLYLSAKRNSSLHRLQKGNSVFVPLRQLSLRGFPCLTKNLFAKILSSQLRASMHYCFFAILLLYFVILTLYLIFRFYPNPDFSSLCDPVDTHEILKTNNVFPLNGKENIVLKNVP